MRILLPADYESAINEVGGIAALLDKNGWKAAAFIAVSVKPGEGQGTSRTSPRGRLSATSFAKKLNAKGWSDKVIARHYQAWEAAAEAGLVPHAADLVYGERIEIPTEDWSSYYPPRWAGDDAAETVAAQAELDGVGKSKAVDISQNPRAMQAAIKADPAVAAAAAQALVDKGDINTLSKATAAVAKNRQVDRNRKRATSGQPKGRTVQDPKPTVGDLSGDTLSEGEKAGLNAFMSVKGLSDALRALVTTFPGEWAALSDLARQDEDFVGACEETLDKIEIALSACRALVSGGVTDEQLQAILDGGES